MRTLTWLPLVFILLLSSCSSNSIELLADSDIVDGEDDRILLVDRNGLEWDITEAVTQLGFDPDKFSGGLGLQRFRPYVETSYLTPDHANFPPLFEDMDVIGVDIGGVERAYDIADLSGIEMVDEHFPGAHVAVGW